MKYTSLIIGATVLFAIMAVAAKLSLTDETFIVPVKTPVSSQEDESLAEIPKVASLITTQLSSTSQEQREKPVVQVPNQQTETALPTYTKETLAQFDGQNPDLPIYIALEGDVYDVTSGRKFYELGGTYHFLAGTDGTYLLKRFGGDTIRKKYPIVGTFND
jgi:predicted heme/steroid binding protein